MGRLLTYMRPYKPQVAVALLFMLGSSLVQILGPLLTKLTIDRYLVPNPNAGRTALDSWLSSDPWTGIGQISAIYLATIVFGFIADFFQTYLMQWTGQQAMFDLRRQLMEHLQQLDIAYYDRNPVGRLITRVTTDVDVLNDLFASGLVTILGDVLMLSFVLIAMVRLSPGLTLFLLAVLPLVVLVTIAFRRAVANSYRRIRIAIAKINSYLQEHITGITVVQLFNREQISREEFERVNREHMIAFKDSINAYGWFYPAVEFLSMLALAMLLSYGGWRVLSGAMTIGVVVAFFQYGLRFFRPIQDLSDKYNILQGAMAASERIFKLLDTPVEIRSAEQPATARGGGLEIQFDHVWFAYKGED